jgi:hypothetical protein
MVFKNSTIAFSNTGDNTVVAAVTGRSIHVMEIQFTNDTATNITFKSGSNSLTGALRLAANSSDTLQAANENTPKFVCNPSEDFIINQSGTANIGGFLKYKLI